MTREPWEEDDEPASVPAAPVAPVTVSKAPSPLRAELEAQLAKRRAAQAQPARVNPASPMRASLEAELARRQSGGVIINRPPQAGGRLAAPYTPGSADPPEGIGSGHVPSGGMKVR